MPVLPPSHKIRVGDFVCLRYIDTVLFKDAVDPSRMKPVTRETAGWVDYVDQDCVRLIWERYAEPAVNDDSRIRSTGLAIRKGDIIEVKKIA